MIKPKKFKFSEYLMGFTTLMWGLWLLFPMQTFASSTVFDLMGSIADENMVGSVMAILGGVWMILIHTGNHFHLRKYIVLIALFLWTVIDFIFILGNFASTATVVYTVIVIQIAEIYSEIVEELIRRRN